MKVLISGASIAGPVLAYWLSRNGFDVTMVERAPALRKTGSTSPPSHGGMGCQRRCTCPCGAIDHPCRQAR